MTPERKVELVNRANFIVDEMPVTFDTQADRQREVDFIIEQLVRIERQTWLAAAKRCESLADLARRDDQLGKQDAYENIADWCQQQAEAAR